MVKTTFGKVSKSLKILCPLLYILRITKSYNNLKITQEARSHGTYILILKLQKISPGYFVDLFICRLIYMFLFNY